MKLETTSRSLTIFLFLFAALMAAFLLPVRLLQQMYLVEPSGFWVDAEHFTVYILYIGLGLLVLVPAAVTLLRRKQTVIDLGRRTRLLEGILAFLAAAALLVSAYTALQLAVQLFKNYGVHMIESEYEVLADAPFQYFMRSGTIYTLLEAVFGVLSAVFFANLALLDLFPKRKIFLNRLMALTPLLWVLFRLLRRFSRIISYLRISDIILDIFMLAALLIFFLAFAQVLSGINSEGKAPRLLAAGLPAAVLCLLCFVPRVAAYMISDRAAPQDALIEWSDPALALFITAFLAGRILQGPASLETNAEEDEELPEEEAAEEPPEEAPAEKEDEEEVEEEAE